MISVTFKDVLFFLSGILIPSTILFYKIVKGQTDLKRDVRAIKSYVILICEKEKIECPSLKVERE